MPTWKKASLVFGGGTSKMREMVDRKVRTRVEMTLPLANEAGKEPATLTIPAKTLARVGYVKDMEDFFRIVVPAAKYQDLKLDELARKGGCQVAIANWPTFREHFDVEC